MQICMIIGGGSGGGGVLGARAPPLNLKQRWCPPTSPSCCVTYTCMCYMCMCAGAVDLSVVFHHCDN